MKSEPAILVSKRVELALMAAVALVSVAVALSLAIDYYRDPTPLWSLIEHDRNGHYQFGLDLALALRSLDPLGFLKTLQSATIWPPVHGLLLALVLLVGGPDHRLGIVPGLMGLVATAMCSWAIAGRLFAEMPERLVAGAVAVIFILGSPALRLLAADVMLETVGAGLTAFALYAYLRAVATPAGARWWRILGLTLTVLFFEKSNYWLLTTASIAIAYAWEFSEEDRGGAGRLLAGIDIRRVAVRACRDPLVIAFVVVLALVVAIYAFRPSAFELLGRRVSVYPPRNLMTAAYALLFLSLARPWWRARPAFAARLGPAALALFYWHVAPIAISFLLPKRLAVFLYYVGPENAPATAMVRFNPWHAVSAQWQWFVGDYHAAPWLGVVAALLAIIGLVRLLWLAPGSRAIVVLTLLCALAVVLHPHQQWRFQSSWMFSLWLASGVGAAALLRAIAKTWRLPAALATTALLGVAQFLPPASAGTSDDLAASGRASDLELSAAYLPYLDGARSIGFAASAGRQPFFAWTTRQHCRCEADVEQPWLDEARTRDEVRRGMADWVAGTTVQVIVLIDTGRRDLPFRPDLDYAADRQAGLRDAMAGQRRYVLQATLSVPDYPAEISIWRRAAGGGGN
jgi:hypothetical protein